MEHYKDKHEHPEEIIFSDLMTAEKEVKTILEEIDEILASTDDRKKAEILVLKSHGPRLEEAQQKSREALERWLKFVRSETENA